MALTTLDVMSMGSSAETAGLSCCRVCVAEGCTTLGSVPPLSKMPELRRPPMSKVGAANKATMEMKVCLFMSLLFRLIVECWMLTACSCGGLRGLQGRMNGSIPDVRKDSLLRRICNPAQQELRISESAKSARTFQ